jgi:hypothetical protein
MRILTAIPILLFGLMFAGGGVFFLATTAFPMWQDWQAMRGWQPALAQLESVRGGGNETKARYRYEFDGATYQGERVYVSTFNDNIGTYHEGLLAELRRHQRAGTPVTVWVNPKAPDEAVIDRDMRWGLFAFLAAFGSVFVLIGLVVTYAGLRAANERVDSGRPSLRALRREWKEKSADPHFQLSFIEYARQRAEESRQPASTSGPPPDWHLRKGWETPKIRSGARRDLIAIWAFAILWNGVSWPVLLVLPEELAKDNYPALFVLLFPLVGLFLLAQAVRKTWEYRRFGVVSFEMDPYPGAIGGHVGGYVQVPRLEYGTAVAQPSTLSVRLECVYSYVSRSGKNHSRRESIKWAEEGAPRIEGSMRGVRLAFRFDVPENLPQADVEQSGAYHFWRLGVQAEIPGIDLNRQFDIPVFKTGETSSAVRHDVSAQVAEQKAQASEATRQSIAQGDFDLPGLSRAMRISTSGSEIRMAFPMFRNRLLTLFAALFAGGFGFASSQMAGMALEGGVMAIFIGLLSAPFVLVAIAASLATIYLPFNNLRVRIARNDITVLRRLLFVPILHRRLRVADVLHLSIKRSGSTGQGVDKIRHFKVLAHDRRGGKVTLAEDIDGEDEAGHFRDYLARYMNVESRA